MTKTSEMHSESTSASATAANVVMMTAKTADPRDGEEAVDANAAMTTKNADAGPKVVANAAMTTSADEVVDVKAKNATVRKVMAAELAKIAKDAAAKAVSAVKTEVARVSTAKRS